MKLRIAAALVAATALVTGACSSDDAKGELVVKAATTTTTTEKVPEVERDIDELVATIQESDDGRTVYSDDDATCVGEAIIDDLSDEGYELAIESDSDFEDYSRDDIQLISDAFDECIEVDAFGALFVELAGDDEIMSYFSPETLVCLGTNLVEQYGGVGPFVIASSMDDDDEMEEAVMVAFGGCVTAADVSGLLVGALMDGGAPEASATCAVNQLLTTYTPADLFLKMSERDVTVQSDLQVALEGCI